MEPAVRIRNLNQWYGAQHVLKDISLDIAPGQIIGYIGPNGAGKSTTVKILCGLLTEFSGEVFLHGMDVRTHPLEVKALIGYVPELAELYEVLTPAEFFALAGALYGLPTPVIEDRSTRMMEAFGLPDHLHQRMDAFSKGMKQKVLLISALLHNPEILILDEPLSGLDANSVILVKELIEKLAASGKTIFYCSHMMDVVEKVSHRIVLIDKGVVVADGSLEDLRKSSHKDSLEAIFADLTGDGSAEDASLRVMNAYAETR
jgi:ABC-2 type transport system ATP-binding protein